MSETAYLECPNCGADAVPSTGFGCAHCDGADGCHEERVLSGECSREEEPLWYEDPNAECLECGVALCVVVDDGRAYCREDTYREYLHCDCGALTDKRAHTDSCGWLVHLREAEENRRTREAQRE